jgi:RND superfamily putative drug exporter
VRARHWVVVGWVVLLAAIGGTALGIMGSLDNEISIPGTEATAALEELSATFPQVSGVSAQVVIVAPTGELITDGEIRGPVTRSVDALARIPDVAAVSSPFNPMMPAAVNASGTATILQVQMTGDMGSVNDTTKDALTAAVAALQRDLPAGVHASLGGQLFATEFPALSLIEATGVVVALIVLVLTLGSFWAAGLPLLNALAGVGVSMGLLFAATSFITVTSMTPMLGVMLGLAVGIDYALFIVHRHRSQLAPVGTGLDQLDRRADDVPESIARATATAGSAVVFAGLTVMIALVGLAIVRIPFLTTMGITAAMSVGIAVLVSLTLTPALLGFAGEKLRPQSRGSRRTRVLTSSTDGSDRRSVFGVWVTTATRRPALTVAIVVVALGALTIPVAGLRLALPDAGGLPADSSARQTYDTISQQFGEGFNGPLLVTGAMPAGVDPMAVVGGIAAEIAQLPGVADIPLATPNQTLDALVIQVTPAGGPTSEVTKQLVEDIRDLRPQLAEHYGVIVSVTGFTAVGIDVSAKLGAALLPFGVVVVLLSLGLLSMVFRSIWVPVTAALGYLLSIGAAMGVVTLVFQHGFLASVLNVAKSGPVISFMPIILMGVLFGLAMDYQVFLVSRMREDYVHSPAGPGRAHAAVVSGFRASAPVVTAAATIMAAVFIAFVPQGDVNIKPIALGLAVGVAIDAFVVRMILVPAVMAWLGDKAWWMPRWLDRALPSFDIEGTKLVEQRSAEDQRELVDA